jgi:hypothetical protein
LHWKINPETEFAPFFGSGFLLGNPYKMVHCQLAPEDETLPTLQVWDLIAEENGTLIVLSFECPMDLVHRNSRLPALFLSSISRSEDLP